MTRKELFKMYNSFSKFLPEGSPPFQVAKFMAKKFNSRWRVVRKVGIFLGVKSTLAFYFR